MSTLILTAATHVGSTVARTAGQVALSYANSAISRAFDNRTIDGPRLESFHLQTSRDGAPMPRVYGRARLAGQVIWASRLLETETESRVGGKGGGPTRRDFTYSVNFAVGLCEGEILSVERIWANGALLKTNGLNIRVYKGTEDQDPDPIISAIDGPDIPTFRGTAYIVFEDFPLDGFGARLPQINVEVLRVPKDTQSAVRMEDVVRGVNLLPSSGEFAYSTSTIETEIGPGQSQPVNVNGFTNQPDCIAALDQLDDQLPNCGSVSIVISWFGLDLRCGQCQIRPGVEFNARQIAEVEWRVGPDTRETAYKVSRDEDERPLFGGTPSDFTISETIGELKSRGYQVNFYPFILMDIPEEANLPDPYGRAAQPPFPWRGRITCDPAPGQAGSPDGTLSVRAQVDAFFGQCVAADFSVDGDGINYTGPAEYGFRRFILHNAFLAKISGGVDRFIIGSEMRGMTTLRGEGVSYPVVEQLIDLAAEVRAMLGADTLISYAADWSEYFGHHPQDGSNDVRFHLDGLWSDDNIDAVGIDAYFPLSDWRDGTEHLDAQIAASIYDAQYLSSRMEAGEGYDWFYASGEDRDTQTRTPITDGAYDKPWVFRYKDVRHWWGEPHYDRSGGVEMDTPTGWVPKSKPIWFLEVGCPAVDKGANQPNVFYDPKSSESFVPYHSGGTRDDLIQRRYIEAFTQYWERAEHNPPSDIYTGPMVDMSALHIWCWDARPFPAFPARSDVWSDGGNWQLGHWITGRTGLIPLADVIHDVSAQAGVSVDVTRVNGLLQGYVIDRPMSARAALEPLTQIYDVTRVETGDGVHFISRGSEPRTTLSIHDVVGESVSEIEMITDDAESQVRDVRLHFIDAARDYMVGSVSTRDRAADTVRVIDITAPILFDHGYAKHVCERILNASVQATQSLHFNIGLQGIALDVGDVFTLGGINGAWRIEALDGDMIKSVQARRASVPTSIATSGTEPILDTLPTWIARPALSVLDIPYTATDDTRSGPNVGVALRPFATTAVNGSVGGSVQLSRRIDIGSLDTKLVRGPINVWDRANRFTARFSHAQFGAVTEAALLAGSNTFAVRTTQGWEVLQAREITLIGEQLYQFSDLIRGLGGSDAEMDDVVEAGAQIIALDNGFEALDIPPDFIGAEISYTATSAGRESAPVTQIYTARHLRPRKPVHVKLVQAGENWLVSWIRQTRVGGYNWAAREVPLGEGLERYRVRIWAGETVLSEIETETTNVSVAIMETANAIDVSQGSDQYGYGPSVKIPIA